MALRNVQHVQILDVIAIRKKPRPKFQDRMQVYVLLLDANGNTAFDSKARAEPRMTFWSPVASFAVPSLCDICYPVSVLEARRVLHSAAMGGFWSLVPV